MLDTSSRLLRLLSLFQARPSWTAAELAERLDITPRTVRRDVTRLRSLGYPVDADAGPYGGYRLGRGGALPPLLLDDDEAVAVAVGLRLAADGSVIGLDEATVSALAKLEQVLPARLAGRVRTVHEATAELQGRDPARVDAEILVALAQACRAGERVRLGYTDRDGHASERLVDPYRLVRSGPRWYVAALDVERRAWRTLRVDRVTAARKTGARVEIVDPPDPVALVARGMSVGPYALVARIRLPMGMSEAQQVVPRTTGMHRPDGPDATIVEIGANRLDAMVGYLAGLAVPVTVLDPPELRDALRRHGEQVAAANRTS